MPNATKIKCMEKVKTLIESNSFFDKRFFKIWKASGGIIAAACPHGGVYSANWLLKAESPRDIADILFSMRHPPNG